MGLHSRNKEQHNNMEGNRAGHKLSSCATKVGNCSIINSSPLPTNFCSHTFREPNEMKLLQSREKKCQLTLILCTRTRWNSRIFPPWQEIVSEEPWHTLEIWEKKSNTISPYFDVSKDSRNSSALMKVNELSDRKSRRIHFYTGSNHQNAVIHQERFLKYTATVHNVMTRCWTAMSRKMWPLLKIFLVQSTLVSIHSHGAPNLILSIRLLDPHSTEDRWETLESLFDRRPLCF